MSTLILLRHGQSQWNLENRFTGWTDVPLTDAGRQDATLAGKALRDLPVDVVFTSRLKRAFDTWLAVREGRGTDVARVVEDSALNERHYGDLQGLNKAETVAKHGEEQVRQWRRSYAVRPPNGESMEDCERRVWPFFTQYVLPELTAGRSVLIVAHGNSLRPIMKRLQNLSPEEASSMEISCSLPYVFDFSGDSCTGHRTLDVPGMEVKGTAKIA
jgi:2,3-bisphosphoglycerate-dependent phosphoglycerate mutase